MTGTKSYKERETEQKRGKKRYLERVIEEKEAQEEIETYKEEKEDYINDNEKPQSFD